MCENLPTLGSAILVLISTSACFTTNVMVLVLEGDVAFARVAVVDATFVILLLVRLAARLAFLFLAATSPSPVPSVPPIDFILRHLRAPLLHVGLRRRARARPAEARDAACGERVGRAAGAQVGELAPARVGACSRVGRAVGGGGALTGREELARVAGGRRARSAGGRSGARERGRDRGGEGESPLIGCLRRRRPGLRRRVLVGTAKGRARAAAAARRSSTPSSRSPPADPPSSSSSSSTAGLQLLPPWPTVAVAILLWAPLYSPSAERRVTAAILVFGEANVNNFDDVGEKARNRRISPLVLINVA